MLISFLVIGIGGMRLRIKGLRQKERGVGMFFM